MRRALGVGDDDGLPPSMTATQVLVVPKSIPIVFAMMSPN